jgi:hypothetical protein
VYEEFPIHALSEEEKITRKCLELDADRTAVLTSLRLWREDWSSESNPLRAAFDGDYVWSMSIDSTFLFMEWVSSRKGISTPGTHPSSLQRLANARMAMDGADQVGLQSLSQAASERKIIGTVLPWINRNLRPSVKRALFENANGEAEGRELENLLHRLQSFDERLERYRAERHRQWSS